MSDPKAEVRNPIVTLMIVMLIVGTLIALLEQGSQSLLARSTSEDGLPSHYAPLAGVLNVYLRARYHVLDHIVLYLALLFFGVPLLGLGLRRLAAGAGHWREVLAGIAFRQESYTLTHPFDGAPEGPLAATQAACMHAMFEENPAPESQVVLGIDSAAQPVYLTDKDRSMHVHCLGLTGCGKTQSVLYPLLYQDARRARRILFLDAKGSADNEDAIARIAATTGRLSSLKIFSFNPHRPCHTYNPLHMTAGTDPRAVAERVFMTFEDDMDSQYYRDQARELWINLVLAGASTGKAITMLDLLAALRDPEIMCDLLDAAAHRQSVADIRSKFAEVGDRFGQTFSGLTTAVSRYDDAALNTYDPDIVLEDLLRDGGIVAFSLQANEYALKARAVGMMVLQHLQSLGSARQMDRSLPQDPLGIYVDEFYNFAYEGMVNALNKLRDAGLSMFLAHQSLSDLTAVSPEFAQGVMDNTRNKIVLLQQNGDCCEQLAATLGTRKNVVHTNRRSADGWLNHTATLDSSSREVDEYVLHPNHIKNLARAGQAYLLPAGVALPKVAPTPWQRFRHGPAPRPAPFAPAVGVHLGLMDVSVLPPATPPAPKVPDTSNGLGLHARYVAKAGRGGTR